ncbi:MAG: endonuclease [Brevundimonas sp.]|nr:endonuclease [Brevundimonas sp.]
MLKDVNHPKYGSVSSAETREAISKGVKEFYRTHTHKSKGLKGVFSPQYGIGGKFVFCYNEKGKELIFPSINGAKQHFKVR